MTGCWLLQEGDFQFPLESVKALRTLFTEDEASAEPSLQELESKAAALCSHPELPAEFRSVCVRSDAGASMARLGKDVPPDVPLPLLINLQEPLFTPHNQV